METIYLVGQISEKYKETYDWRSYIEGHFYGVENIQVINPCINSFNQELIKNKYEGNYYTKEFGIDVIVSKDLNSIKRCTIAIVNLNQYDKDRPLLGSYFEMAWLYERPSKTVIGFASDLDSYLCRHPFTRQTVHTWCKNEDEACNIIEKYFLK
jgi:nucleoside 2-deoxyribosyltransferase